MLAADVELLEVRLPLLAWQTADLPEPPRLGADAHRLFFGLLARNEGTRALSERLHAGPGGPGFTASAVLDGEGDPVRRVEQGQVYQLRLTFLTPDALRAWGEVRPAWPARLHLGPERVFHPPSWPCSYDFESAVDQALVRTARYAELAARPSVRWRLRFASPVAFEVPGKPKIFLPLPVPAEILKNLGRRWERQYAPPDLQALAARERVEQLAGQLQLEAGALRLTGVALPEQERFVKRVGFVGELELAYRSHPGLPAEQNAARVRLLSALLRFGELAGLGVQTARGMGMLRAEPL